MKITRVQRLVWDQMEKRTRQKLLAHLPWVPEAVMIFDTNKSQSFSTEREWCDRIEDLSGGRTFPFGLKDDSAILYDINRARPALYQWIGCIAFERDEDSIRFLLSEA